MRRCLNILTIISIHLFHWLFLKFSIKMPRWWNVNGIVCRWCNYDDAMVKTYWWKHDCTMAKTRCYDDTRWHDGTTGKTRPHFAFSSSYQGHSVFTIATLYYHFILFKRLKYQCIAFSPSSHQVFHHRASVFSPLRYRCRLFIIEPSRFLHLSIVHRG